jgi:hypothetical protein
MTIYILIDGDNIGDKITRSYLENDEMALARIIQDLNSILGLISEHLKLAGFEIIFCAADGVACKGSSLDIDTFVRYIKAIGKPAYTFSVGIGKDLQTSFFALKYAKAVGEANLAIYEEGSSFKLIDLAA